MPLDLISGVPICWSHLKFQHLPPALATESANHCPLVFFTCLWKNCKVCHKINIFSLPDKKKVQIPPPPPQPSKVQIPNSLGTENGKMPEGVGVQGSSWLVHNCFTAPPPLNHIKNFKIKTSTCAANLMLMVYS